MNGKAGGNFKEVATRGNRNGSVVSTFLPLPLRERSVCRRDGFQSRIRQLSGAQNEPVLLNPVNPVHTWASNGFFGGARGGDTVNKGSYVIK